MTTLANTFEGGTNGVTLTAGNTGGASGNALDVINHARAVTTDRDLGLIRSMREMGTAQKSTRRP